MENDSWHLVEGYRPGILGACTRMHAIFYARYAGFGAFFEGQVAVGMADFLQRLDRPQNNIWSAFATACSDVSPWMARISAEAQAICAGSSWTTIVGARA